MKKAAFGTACGLIAFFVFAVMLTVYGRQIRQEEVDSALSQAIDTTLSGVMRETNYTIRDNEAFVVDFLKALLVQTNSDSKLTVSVLDADYKRGILSVEITETFRHPNGKEGTVSEMRTVIFDRNHESDQTFQNVRFYVSDRLYKEYKLLKGSACPIPIPPERKGKVFRCWRFAKNQKEAGGIKAEGNDERKLLAVDGAPYIVSEDTSLTAVFE